MRARVLIVPVSYPSPQDPVTGVFVRDQAQILAREHDVTVLATSPVSVRSPRGWRAGWIDEIDDAGVRLWCVHEPAWPTPGALWDGAFGSVDGPLRKHLGIYTRAVTRGVREYTRRFGPPDIVHAHMVLPAGAAAVRAAATIAPVVITEHTSPASAYARTRWARHASGRAYAGAREVVGVSPWLIDQVRAEFSGITPRLVPNVVREDVFVPPAPTDFRADRERTILCVAAHIPGKGVEHLIDAAHRLMGAQTPPWRVVLAGDGPLHRALIDQAAGGPASGRVRFVPARGRDEVVALLHACDLLVMPSELETFGLIACEAGACGRPVIAAASGGAAYTLTPQTGRLVPPGDSAALASSIEDWLSGRWSVDPTRARGSVIERFGTRAFLDHVRGIYDRVARRA